MISLFRHHVPVGTAVQVITDGILFYLATILAAHVAVLSESVPANQVMASAMLYTVIAVTVGSALGLYRRGDAEFAVMAGRAIMTVLVAAGASAVIFPLMPWGVDARGILGYAALYSLASLLLVRQLVVIGRRSGVGRRPVLIVGTGDEARAVQQTLGTGGSQFSVVGFYRAGSEAVVIDPSSPLFSNDEELCEVVRRLGVREVIVAVRDQRGGALPLKQLLECRISGVPVLDLAAFYEREHGQVPVESLKSSWLIYGQGFAQDPVRTAVKRSFDIVCSSVLLLATAPVMVVAALAIAIEDGRPIFYRQKRAGRGGRAFNCFKFRSMRPDAEGDGVARWARAGDPRVTRVGRVLRNTRVDELPQLFNVFRGEMSLVGPRPERPEFVADLARQIPFYDVRHSVKPGITGWAQVRYTYGASVEDAKRKLQYDLYYVKNHSLFLDVLILIETVRVVLFAEGAQ